MFGTKPAFNFEPKDHLELAKHLSLLDFETGSIVSGAKFYYSFNEAVRAPNSTECGILTCI